MVIGHWPSQIESTDKIQIVKHGSTNSEYELQKKIYIFVFEKAKQKHSDKNWINMGL